MGQKIASLYAEIGADTTKLEAGLKRTKSELNDTAAQAKTANVRFADLAKGFSLVGGSALAIGAAINGALSEIMELGRAGGELAYAQTRFDRLAGSINTVSSSLLNDLRTATKGTISDARLVASAGDLMALGLAKSNGEVVRLARVVGGLGMDMNQLVLTLTNQTTMRFDSLGVSVDGFDEKVKRLKDSGMEAGAAFKEAFLQQAEEQLQRVGDKADTASAAMDRYTASVENYQNELKQNAFPAIADLADFMVRQKQLTDDAQTGWMKWVPGINAVETAFRGLQAVLGIETETEKKAAEEGKRNASNKAWADRYQAQADAMGKQAEAARKAAASIENLAYAEEFASTEGEAMAGMIEYQKGKLEEYQSKLENLRGATGNLIAAQDRFNVSFGDKLSSSLESAGVSGKRLEEAYAQIDQRLGTNYEATYKAEEGMDKLIRQYATGQITAGEFGAALEGQKGAWENLDQDLQKAKRGFEEAKASWNDFIRSIGAANGMQITINVDVLRSYSDNPGAPSGNRSGERWGGSQEALGGPVAAGMPYWVGERGAEPFIPAVDGRVLSRQDAMAALASSAASGSGGIAIENINLPGVTNARQFIAELGRLSRNAANSGAGYAGR